MTQKSDAGKISRRSAARIFEIGRHRRGGSNIGWGAPQATATSARPRPRRQPLPQPKKKILNVLAFRYEEPGMLERLRKRRGSKST